MSLNGLDDVKVIEAHDAAIAEPGGWFLLKYAARDEVVLLGKGNGGIVEIRNSIAQFEESSPLFGFLRYRRRSVLIKYVPEDCSRLVQARVSVHFSAFTERFTPHDVVFPIACSKELRDTSLSAACSLHTASGSTSSSTSSLRRRRLMEIAEEAEEDERVKRQSTEHEQRSTTGKDSAIQTQLASGSIAAAPTTNSLSTNPEIPANPKSSTHPTSENIPSSPTARRFSSQSVRPHMYSLSSYGTSNKPKIKLGPRPSLDHHKAASDSGYRPVASLPAGLKLFRRGSKKQKSRPQSTYQSAGISLPITGETAEMRDPIRPHTSGGRPTTSSGASIRSAKSGTTLPGGLPPASMTPEKARLMKALEMRKKKLSSASAEPLSRTPQNVMESHEGAADYHAEREARRLSNAKENDSGVVVTIGYENNDFRSEITKTDSSPTSPVGTDHAASTKASSLSESTEETVKEEARSQKEHPSSEEVTPDERAETDSVDTDMHPLSDVDEAQEDEIPEDETKTAQSTTHISPTLDPSTTLDGEPHISRTTGDETESEHCAKSDLNMTHIQDPPKVAPLSSEELVAEASNIPHTEPPSVISTPLNENEPKEDRISSVIDTNVELEAETTSITPVSEQVRQINFETNQDVSESPATTQPPPRDLKIPRSKFSIPDLRTPENMEIGGQQEFQISSANRPPEMPTGLGLLGEKDIHQKHRGKTSHLDRLRPDMSTANSDDEFLEDDDLMDELQSATVQEAKPVSVAKSPVSQMFPAGPEKGPSRTNGASRVLSNPLVRDDLRTKSLALPEKAQVARSVSAGDAFLNRISQQQSAPVVKKVNVGSGISQRIKALEKLSSSSPASGTMPSSGSTSPAFFSVRQSSVRSTRAPSIADRANSLTKSSPSLSHSPSYSGDIPPEVAKLRDRAGSVQSRKETFNNIPSSRTPTPNSSRSESISVTARIVRDSSQPFPESGRDASEYGPLDLKSSPLIIDHQKAVPTPKHPTIQERRSSKDIKNERRSSMTIVKDLFTSPRRSSFSSIGRQSITIEPPEPSPRPETSASIDSRRLSTSSRRSIKLSLSPSAPSPISPRDKPPLSAGHPKSEGRGMKMLKRMSSGFSNGRKNLSNAISPTIRENTELAAPSLQTSSQTSQSSLTSTEVGDVNVQFPDTLLWKRRHLLLDAQGFLVLSASQAHGASNAIAATKRYHMSDLKLPYIPDIECQELPNSVSLDFIQGGGLQFACEDRAAQSHVLHLLEDAHRAWTNSQQ